MFLAMQRVSVLEASASGGVMARRLPGPSQEAQGLSAAAKHVGRVRKLFPDWAEEVSRLALRNEEFRTLCEDYGMAADALDLLELRNLPQDVEKMHEYRDLIRDLEKELKHELFAPRPHAERR